MNNNKDFKDYLYKLIAAVPLIALGIGAIKDVHETADKQMVIIEQNEQETVDWIKDNGQYYIDLYNDLQNDDEDLIEINEEPVFDKIEDKVCYLFNNKYGLNLSSDSVHINSVSKADNKTVIQTVINSDSNEIQVYFYQDDNYITDDYSKVIYEDLITDTINQILSDNKIDNPDYYMFYSMNKVKYLDINDYNEYLLNTDTHIVLNINVDNMDNYKESIVKLCNDFDENNLKYIISITLKEDTIKLYRDKQHLEPIRIDDIDFNKEND